MRTTKRVGGALRLLTIVTLALGVAAAGCGGSDGRVVVRGPDDVQVMTPHEVEEMRGEAEESAEAVAAGSVPGQTVPQNQDDRPAEVRLFEAFTGFRSCLEDDGFQLEGNLQDPDNPAFDNPEYVASLRKCAARTHIAEIYQEMQQAAQDMTPDQVQERNESFVKVQECLERRGWDIQTTTNEIGLITPTRFVNAEGELDERDIEQCASEIGVDL